MSVTEAIDIRQEYNGSSSASVYDPRVLGWVWNGQRALM